MTPVSWVSGRVLWSKSTDLPELRLAERSGELRNLVPPGAGVLCESPPRQVLPFLSVLLHAA